MGWRASTRSTSNGGEYAETPSDAGVILVRDTTNRDGGTLTLTAPAWERFADSPK